MLTSLTVLQKTGLELARCRRNNENGNIGLRRARDRVLDEVTRVRSANDREGVLVGLLHKSRT